MNQNQPMQPEMQQQHQDDTVSIDPRADSAMDGGFRDVTGELKKSKRGRSKIKPGE